MPDGFTQGPVCLGQSLASPFPPCEYLPSSTQCLLGRGMGVDPLAFCIYAYKN